MKTLAAAFLVASIVAGCRSIESPRAAENESRFDRVRNGSVISTARLDLLGATRITLPLESVIQRGGDEGELHFILEKKLDFFGFPPERIDISSAQANLGLAYRRDGASIVIATFGEWDSDEGGASVTLTVAVPAGIEFDRATGLSGETSAAWKDRQTILGPDPTSVGFWYVAGEPAYGWTELPDSPSRTQ